jgi:hypothetical protein
MPRKELPIVVRLSQLELAEALGQPADDSSVQRMGGLTVVLRPIQPGPGPEPTPAPLDLVGATGGPPALRALAGAFRPIEQSLFRRLKANPALARRFVLEPRRALAELGLVPPGDPSEPMPAHPLASNPLRLERRASAAALEPASNRCVRLQGSAAVHAVVEDRTEDQKG